MRHRPRSIAPTALPLGFLATTAGGLALLLRTRELLAAAVQTPTVDGLVGLAVVAAGTLLCAWLVLSLFVASVCAGARAAGCTWRTGELVVRRWAPRVVRRAVLSVVVTGIGLGAGGVAQADGVDPAVINLGWTVSAVPAPTTGSTTTAVSSTLPVAIHELSGAAAANASTQEAATQGTYLVQPGDSLWSITARHLPAAATRADISHAWPDWYALNKDTIGADPDVIHPGARLTIPADAARSAS